MGSVDLFHSRRANYARCQYWSRNENDTLLLSEWVINNKPEGIFYAKPVSIKSNEMNVLVGVFALDDDHITLETDDDVIINRGYVIKYNNDLWLVQNVQKIIHQKETEFSKKIHYKHVISIVRSY